MSVSKTTKMQIVGGDAYIAPAVKCYLIRHFRQIRNILQRADVGIGPYRQIFRQAETRPSNRKGGSFIR